MIPPQSLKYTSVPYAISLSIKVGKSNWPSLIEIKSDTKKKKLPVIVIVATVPLARVPGHDRAALVTLPKSNATLNRLVCVVQRKA